MAEIKTKKNNLSVEDFLNRIEDVKKREDAYSILKIMAEVTGEKAEMWGETIVGFGSYHYKYESGREGDYCLTGFSPRKQNLTVYIMPGFDKYPELMEKLGKYKTGSSCLYVKKLEDISIPVLRELIAKSVADMKKQYKA